MSKMDFHSNAQQAEASASSVNNNIVVSPIAQTIAHLASLLQKQRKTAFIDTGASSTMSEVKFR